MNLMLLVFASSIFLSAALLFIAEPLVARMLLPAFGGSPAVWNTAMVFYQVVLLGAYLYAHLLGRHLRPRLQILVHLLVVGVASVGLPPMLPEGWSPDPQGNPTLSVLLTLVLVIGPAFFAVSTTGPLLQRWFSTTDHPSARDPYFLYAASNAGSLLGLLSYPTLVETSLSLGSQARVWSFAYAGLGIGLLLAAASLLRGQRNRTSAGSERQEDQLNAAPRSPYPPWRERLIWLGLAFVPSSLTLGVTSHITTDVASVPMLWIAPLTVYLSTFIIAFSRIGASLTRSAPALVLPMVLLLAVSFQLDPSRLMVVILPAQLLGLLIIATAFHVRLSSRRPHPDHLTGYYLWISLGGALGGVFNALLAPMLFNDTYEYPLVLALAVPTMVAISQRQGPLTEPRWRTWGPALGYSLVVLGVLRLVRWIWQNDPASIPHVPPVIPISLLSLPLLLPCFRHSPRRLSLPLLVLLLLSFSGKWMENVTVVYRERSFFGRCTVISMDSGSWHALRHGRTIHGVQGSGHYRDIPTVYYHPSGPIGQVFQTFQEDPRLASVGVVGLGVGSLAAYARPGQTMVFFEIDPGVLKIALDPRWFTFLSQAAARREADSKVELRFVLGDGRLGLEGLPDGRFGLLVLDAFSSDSVPVHLLTVEAFALYLKKLQPQGLLALHISNNHVNLRRVLAAACAELGLSGWSWFDQDPSFQDEAKQPSEWALIARNESDLLPLIHSSGPEGEPRWNSLSEIDKPELWTDDHASLLRLIRW